MKQMILSIQPQWCEKIANKQKTVEIRKSKPKCEIPFKVYIYQSKGKTMFVDVLKDGEALPWSDEVHRGKTEILTCPKGLGVSGGPQKIIGEFICDEIIEICYNNDLNRYNQMDSDNGKYLACLSMKEAKKYGKGKSLYAWHISDLVIYEKAKELEDFASGNSVFYFNENGNVRLTGMKKPPQNYVFVEQILKP